MDIRNIAESYRQDVCRFLTDMIAIPSESCREAKVVKAIAAEMENLGFQEVFTDKVGNIIGRIGKGPRCIVYDSHVDTVGIGDRKEWTRDPYRAVIENGILYGRGAGDNEGGVAAMVYGAKALLDMGIPDEVTLYVIGSVQEEDCDGHALGYALEHSIPKAHAVVLGECTNLEIYRGHRGRMEMLITTTGVSCHGSAPDRGVNALYRMAPVLTAIEKLNQHLRDDDFLGKGTIAATFLETHTGSLNTVPNKCTLFLDRRLTAGETRESAVAEVEEALHGLDAQVEVLQYSAVSHCGCPTQQEKYFPTWTLPEDHPLVQAGLDAYQELFTRRGTPSRWVFSTNGVSSMGRLGIPTIGFGPGEERFAHTVNDQVPVDHLVKAIEFYARLPRHIAKRMSSNG